MLVHRAFNYVTAMLIEASQIKDAVGNEYGKPKDVVGEKRMAFTSHADSAFDVCFENLLTGVWCWSGLGYTC